MGIPHFFKRCFGNRVFGIFYTIEREIERLEFLGEGLRADSWASKDQAAEGNGKVLVGGTRGHGSKCQCGIGPSEAVACDDYILNGQGLIAIQKASNKASCISSKQSVKP